jgi:oleandomycin transport system ATP-binding protein
LILIRSRLTGSWQRFVRDLTAACRSIGGMNVADVPYAVEARGLVKRFGKTTALAGVDLTARAGTVLGLLGPNGAGKTTAVRILATLLRPDSGEASICGYNTQRDAHQVRQLIGLTGQYASVDEGLSGTNNLIMIGRLLGLGRHEARARAAELLARFELSDAAGRRAKTYSGGMRRRLDLAASLVGRPRVLCLDEPTTGLDPHSRNEVWAMIREMVARRRGHGQGAARGPAGNRARGQRRIGDRVGPGREWQAAARDRPRA